MGMPTERARLHLPDCLAAAGVVGAWTHDVASDRVVADKDVASLFASCEPTPAAGIPWPRTSRPSIPRTGAVSRAGVESASRRGMPFALEYRVRTGDGVRLVRDYGSFSLP